MSFIIDDIPDYCVHPETMTTEMTLTKALTLIIRLTEGEDIREDARLFVGELEGGCLNGDGHV